MNDYDDDYDSPSAYRRLILEDLFSGLDPKGPAAGNVNNLIYVLKNYINEEQETLESDLKDLEYKVTLMKRSISDKKLLIERAKNVLSLLEETKCSLQIKKEDLIT